MGLAIRARDNDTKEECRDFLQLMSSEWGTRVTKQARLILNERKFNEKKSLPEPEDLKKLAKSLNVELQNIDLSDVSYHTYHQACTLVVAKLISYNRRRAGEVQAIK